MWHGRVKDDNTGNNGATVAGAGAAGSPEHGHTRDVVVGDGGKGAVAGKTAGSAAAVGARRCRGTGAAAAEVEAVAMGLVGAIGAAGAL